MLKSHIGLKITCPSIGKTLKLVHLDAFNLFFFRSFLDFYKYKFYSGAAGRLAVRKGEGKAKRMW